MKESFVYMTFDSPEEGDWGLIAYITIFGDDGKIIGEKEVDINGG